MEKRTILSLILFLAFSCSTTKHNSYTYYSSDHKSFDEVSQLYKNVPVIQTHLVRKLVNINFEHTIAESGLSKKVIGIVSCQPLINAERTPEHPQMD